MLEKIKEYLWMKSVVSFILISILGVLFILLICFLSSILLLFMVSLGLNPTQVIILGILIMIFAGIFGAVFQVHSFNLKNQEKYSSKFKEEVEKKMNKYK